MKFIPSTLFCLALLFSSTLHAKPRPVDAYFIYGQSNSNGRSYNHEFSNQVLQQAYSTNIHYAYHELAWKDGSHPVNVTLGSIRPDSRNRVGVEVTLGRYLSAHSPNPVLLVKFSSGGTAIKNYLPSANNLFQPMIAYLKGKEEEMSQLGYQVQWKAAFVITGESDSNENNAAKFKKQFLTIQQALSDELGLPALPITYSLLRGHLIDTPSAKYSKANPWAALINQEMTTLAANDNSIRVTPSNKDLKTRLDNGDSKTDGIHYCSDSYALLGSRLYFTAFPRRSSVIDRNSNGLSDIWELKYPANKRNSPVAQKDQADSLQNKDSDHDGITDWAEQQLDGFDSKHSDSFAIGHQQSDLPILLSMLDRTKPYLRTITATWTKTSATRSIGNFAENTITWIGSQHSSTGSAQTIVTANDKGSGKVSHELTFSKAVANLRLTVSGMGKNGQVSFDAPFTVIEKANEVSQDGNHLHNQGTHDATVRIEFKQAVTQLTIITPGNDATKFSFDQTSEALGRPLNWRK